MGNFILSFLDPPLAHAGPETCCLLLLIKQGMFYRQGLHFPATSEVRNAACGAVLLFHEHLESGLAEVLGQASSEMSLFQPGHIYSRNSHNGFSFPELSFSLTNYIRVVDKAFCLDRDYLVHFLTTHQQNMFFLFPQYYTLHNSEVNVIWDSDCITTKKGGRME